MSEALARAVDDRGIKRDAHAALIERLEDFDFQTGIVADVAQRVGVDLEGMFDADQPGAERFDRAVRDQVIEAVKVLKGSFPGR